MKIVKNDEGKIKATPEERLIHDIECLVEFFKDDPERAGKYRSWIGKVRTGKLSDSLRGYLERQLDYWMQKDREYGSYLEGLLYG